MKNTRSATNTRIVSSSSASNRYRCTAIDCQYTLRAARGARGAARVATPPNPYAGAEIACRRCSATARTPPWRISKRGRCTAREAAYEHCCASAHFAACVDGGRGAVATWPRRPPCPRSRRRTSPVRSVGRRGTCHVAARRFRPRRIRWRHPSAGRRKRACPGPSARTGDRGGDHQTGCALMGAGHASGRTSCQGAALACQWATIAYGAESGTV